MGFIRDLFSKKNNKDILNESIKLFDSVNILEKSNYFIVSKDGYYISTGDNLGSVEDLDYEKSRKVLIKDISYLGMAHIWSLNSHCLRKKTGALIVKSNMIISDGYNGTPYGFSNICEENGVTKDDVLHAEVNALAKIAKSTNSSDNSVMYCTLSPCMNCARLIYQSGIKKLIFSSIYRDISGIKFLIRAGVKLKYINKKLIDKSVIDSFNL